MPLWGSLSKMQQWAHYPLREIGRFSWCCSLETYTYRVTVCNYMLKFSLFSMDSLTIALHQVSIHGWYTSFEVLGSSHNQGAPHTFWLTLTSALELFLVGSCPPVEFQYIGFPLTSSGYPCKGKGGTELLLQGCSTGQQERLHRIWWLLEVSAWRPSESKLTSLNTWLWMGEPPCLLLVEQLGKCDCCFLWSILWGMGLIYFDSMCNTEGVGLWRISMRLG